MAMKRRQAKQHASQTKANRRARSEAPSASNSTPVSNSASSTTSFSYRQPAGDLAAALLNAPSFQAVHRGTLACFFFAFVSTSYCVRQRLR